MSAAITFSKIDGQSSLSQPCSVMSGYTPVAISWSTARMTSTETPLRSMIATARSASPRVLEASGERFSVQLMNTALRSEKSHFDSLASSSCCSVRFVIGYLLTVSARSVMLGSVSQAHEGLRRGRAGPRSPPRAVCPEAAR